MIYIGVTGWGDQDSLYRPGTRASSKLKEYAGHFPIVEVDSSFYAIQPTQNVEKWIRDTPDSFQFIVKAYQGMTGHIRNKVPFNSIEEMFVAFRDSLKPFIEEKKLAMVLFQFPPWFDCRRENVEYLRRCREFMGDTPVALEFRHQTWFSNAYLNQTLLFMEKEKWIHSICDEPQAGEGSVPTILHPTDEEKTLIRLHGRNVYGWNKQSGENWREVRYLYRYNEIELQQWCKKIKQLSEKTKDIYVLFNNNSGGDAADNAKELITMLNIEYKGLAPRQLDLFY